MFSRLLSCATCIVTSVPSPRLTPVRLRNSAKEIRLRSWLRFAAGEHDADAWAPVFAEGRLMVMSSTPSGHTSSASRSCVLLSRHDAVVGAALAGVPSSVNVLSRLSPAGDASKRLTRLVGMGDALSQPCALLRAAILPTSNVVSSTVLSALARRPPTASVMSISPPAIDMRALRRVAKAPAASSSVF